MLHYVQIAIKEEKENRESERYTSLSFFNLFK